MTPQPLDQRIAGALRLASMTTSQLACTLSVTWRTAWEHVSALRSHGRILPAGRCQTGGAPAVIWRNAQTTNRSK